MDIIIYPRETLFRSKSCHCFLAVPTTPEWSAAAKWSVTVTKTSCRKLPPSPNINGAPESTRGLVKGFMLSGPPGTGKTTLAKRLAYELGRRFEAEDEPPVALAFIDGGEISRSRYGESEERIRDIFLHARSGFTAQGQRSVLLFDDVESIFMARGSQHAKEWHFSQDSVFFHSIDDLDTSRATIVLTSNRPDLIDEAIRDRFLSYVVDYPDLDTLLQMVQQIPAIEQLSGTQQTTLKNDLIAAVKNGTVRSMRDGQRFAMRHFVAKLLKKESLAQQIAD